MNVPPGPPDPDASTQPLPVAPTPVVPAPAGAYAHRFGNVPGYLLRRLGGFAIDAAAIPFVLAAFGFAAYDRGTAVFAARDVGGFEALVVAAFCIALVFAFACEALTGTTLGKLVFALHVRRVDGGHAGGGRILARSVLVPLDLLAIGPLLALVTPRRQRVGDFVGGTVVSQSRIGAFASLIGVLLVCGIGYAEFVYGGGITSGVEVAAEASIVAAPLVSKFVSLTGFGGAKLPMTSPAVAASAEPSAQPTDDSPATPVPSAVVQ